MNSFREQDDYEGFKLSSIVNFGIDTQIGQDEYLKGDVNDLSEKLYQEATQNYERKLEDLRDPERNYNKMSPVELTRKHTPAIAWNDRLRGLGLRADDVIVG